MYLSKDLNDYLQWSWVRYHQSKWLIKSSSPAASPTILAHPGRTKARCRTWPTAAPGSWDLATIKPKKPSTTIKKRHPTTGNQLNKKHDMRKYFYDYENVAKYSKLLLNIFLGTAQAASARFPEGRHGWSPSGPCHIRPYGLGPWIFLRNQLSSKLDSLHKKK